MASPASTSSLSSFTSSANQNDNYIRNSLFNNIASPASPALPANSTDSFTYNSSFSGYTPQKSYYNSYYSTYNYLNNIPSLNTITGSIPLTYYQNLNLDVNIQHRMVKYYKKKLKKWLATDLKDLLLKVKFGDNDYMKIKHILNKVMGKYEMEMILTDYINKTGASWVDLTKNNEYIKELFKYKINKKLSK